MITKQRLKELIEQGATIYEAKYNHIQAIDLSKRKVDFISEKYNVIRFESEINDKWKHNKYFKHLFETEEDARWELEMTATRTETLKLPKWEEFNKNSYFQFVSKDMSNIVLTESSYLDIEEYIDGEFVQTYFHKEMNKENYIEACKLCKKLFLGEEV